MRFASQFSNIELRPRRREKTRPRYCGLDISVLIATRNDARLMPTVLASLFRQTEPVLEVLVLNDGTSAMEDLQWLERIEKCPPVRIIETTNRGLTEARRRLLSEARGDLVLFLDADDYLDSTYVEKTLAALNAGSREFDAALTRRQNFGENNHEYTCFLLGTKWHWILNDLRMTALIERRVFDKIPFDKEMLNGEADDWWWWLRFASMVLRQSWCQSRFSTTA